MMNRFFQLGIALVGIAPIGIAMSSSAALAANFSEVLKPGIYKGKGEWRDILGSSGTMEVQTSIVRPKGRTGVTEIGSRYTVIRADGATSLFQYSFTAIDRANGFFDVIIAGSKAGRGYCYDKQCHYEARFWDGAWVDEEETLTIGEKSYVRMGSKCVPNTNVITWQQEDFLEPDNGEGPPKLLELL